MKRLLFLIHRWAGVVLCLFMAMWFVSGVVMMYVGYPKLTLQERLAALPVLDAKTCCTLPSLAAEPQSVRLTSIGGTQQFVVEPRDGQPTAYDAATGTAVASITEAAALRSARAYLGEVHLAYLGRIAEDAWTHSRALDAHRPFHGVQAEDPARTLVYVSGRTGEVVRDATLTERRWNWVGAWIHWLYPFRGGALDFAWTDIVIWTSVAGTVLALTGVVAGILRWRFSGSYKTGSRSPYRGSLFRWHHIAGLVFGLVTITWIFSGLMSMNPWKVFDSRAPSLDQVAFAGGELDLARPSLPVGALLDRLRASGFHARELEWRMIGGALNLLAFDGSGGTRMIATDGASGIRLMLPIDQLARDGARLLPAAKAIRQQWLTEYDSYYYSRAAHTMLGHVEHRLPMLRLEFDDPHQTWVHLDPHTGEVAGQLDRHQRVKRWLFAFLHSFDWWPLLAARPLWDVLLVLASLGGVAISVTGTWMGWRRVVLKAGQVRLRRDALTGLRREHVRPVILLFCVGALMFWAVQSFAHDTWQSLAMRQPGKAGDHALELALTSAERFPVPGTGPQADRLQSSESASVSQQSARVPDAPSRSALHLSAAISADAAISCWVEIKPREIDLNAPKVARYLAEVRASLAVRDAWTRLPEPRRWRETYSKTAQWIRPSKQRLASMLPTAVRGTALEFVLRSVMPGRPGATLEIPLLRELKPLGGWAGGLPTRAARRASCCP